MSWQDGAAPSSTKCDSSNPLHGPVTKETATVNCEPFSVQELKSILNTCARDDFIRPIFVTGICTSM